MDGTGEGLVRIKINKVQINNQTQSKKPSFRVKVEIEINLGD